MVHNFHPKICHPDRSEAQWRDLAFQPFASFPEPAEICAEFRGYHTSADRRPRDRRNPRAPGSRTSCAQTDHPPARRPDLDHLGASEIQSPSRSSRPNHPAYLPSIPRRVAPIQPMLASSTIAASRLLPSSGNGKFARVHRPASSTSIAYRKSRLREKSGFRCRTGLFSRLHQSLRNTQTLLYRQRRRQSLCRRHPRNASLRSDTAGRHLQHVRAAAAPEQAREIIP